MQMQRRNRWMLVALVLLPSVIGITTLSVLQLADQGQPVAPTPAATPTHEAPRKDGTPLMETTPPVSTPTSAPVSPTIKVTDPEVNEPEDFERRPRIRAVMLADNLLPR